ncbi:MAG: HPP family protein [Marinomonas sp.]|jgi:CBS-domain-containing membrane protein|uniref:HPP family protein n=1 Tax=Marinomonas TaxID=28253 RepID=UPI0037CC5F57
MVISAFKTFCQFIGIETNRTSHIERLISGLTTCLAIAVVVLVTKWSLSTDVHILFFASTAATAFLVFTLPHGALSQPWPVLAGQSISIVVGVSFASVLDSSLMTAALAVGLTVILMHYLGCLHPPGGATAFYFVVNFEHINVSESVVVFIVNILIILALAMIINNLFHWRRYPLFWLNRKATAQQAHKDASSVEHFNVEDLHQVLQQQDVFVDVSLDELQSIYDAAHAVAKQRQRVTTPKKAKRRLFRKALAN